MIAGLYSQLPKMNSNWLQNCCFLVCTITLAHTLSSVHAIKFGTYISFVLPTLPQLITLLSVIYIFSCLGLVETPPGPHALSHVNLAWNYIQIPTPWLSPISTLTPHGFPSFIQQSSFEQPSAHSLWSSCPTQMPSGLYLRIPRT